MSDNQGYFTQPTIHNDTIVFISDDDLWTVSKAGGLAQRLTANVGTVSSPRFSPDGKRIAYLANDRGHLGLYVIAANGGTPTQLIPFSISNLVGWKNQDTIVFASALEQRFNPEIYEFDLKQKTFQKLDFGDATYLFHGKAGAMLLARNTRDSARWKRYKGGTAGVLWTRSSAKEKFQRILKNITTNIASPRLVNNKIYFISDHEGSANVYRCELDGKDLKRLTHHEDYYVRHLETDGTQLIYQHGAEIFVLDLNSNRETKINIECPTPGTQALPRFENAASFLEYYAVSENAQELSVVARGHGFSMPVFGGPVNEWDLLKDVRYRLPTYSADSKYLYFAGTSSDREDRLIRCQLDGRKTELMFEKKDWGVIWNMVHNPKTEVMAVGTNRSELYLVDLKTKKIKLIEKNLNGQVREFNWSPDGRYLVYSAPTEDARRYELRIYDSKTKKIRPLIHSVLHDGEPVFSIDGQYIYFLSLREFNPVYNATHFDLGFPFGGKPYVVALTKTAPNPFKAAFGNFPLDLAKTPDTKAAKKKAAKPAEIQIDFDGIDHRIMAFPVKLKEYRNLKAIPGGVLYLTKNVEPLNDFSLELPSPGYDLCAFKFEENKEEFWHASVRGFDTVHGGQYVLFSANKTLRMVSSSGKPNSETVVGKKSGWIDLDRIRFEIHPREEWRQMYREAWYLQKEHFWRADMSQINWENTYKKYLTLLARVKTRGEFSDLIWEMQGDLGTSHCYEMGGQYLRVPKFNIVGLLGAEFDFLKKNNSFKVRRIYRGDSWLKGQDSPLLGAGVSMKEGDEILRLNGHGFLHANDIYTRLQNFSNVEIQLTIRRQGKKESENITVKALPEQKSVQYRDWVEANRAYVGKISKGKLGYVHIPNMGVWGYSEFYRGFLTEIAKDGLIVDVRFNGGGHVSQHILKVLAQKPLGVDLTRYQGTMIYPSYASRGPIIGLTNEHAGSDGDIFSHSFKMMKLGKLIGKRTWGGVIGINSQYSLRDRTMVTQPEYSYWFNDVGWNVENYGTDPDIEVEITPEDYQAGRDPQLDRAVEEALLDLKIKPAYAPELGQFPNLSQPKFLKVPAPPKLKVGKTK